MDLYFGLQTAGDVWNVMHCDKGHSEVQHAEGRIENQLEEHDRGMGLQKMANELVPDAF